MNQKERMLKELPYQAWRDGLAKERLENKKRIYRYNHLAPDAKEERDALIREIFGKTGTLIHVEEPFRCEYGGLQFLFSKVLAWAPMSFTVKH